MSGMDEKMVGQSRLGAMTVIAAALLAGTYCSLVLTQQGLKYLTWALPISLPMAALSVIALSSLCVWGLIFTIPMYYMCRSALQGASLWRACLPMFVMQAMMTTINQMFSGEVQWRMGGKALGIEAIVLFLVVSVNGWSVVKTQFSCHWGELRSKLAKLKAESEAEEATKKAAEESKKNSGAEEKKP